MGDFPLMTENGTFIINGAERVVVSQLIRSPGVYFTVEEDRITGRELCMAKLIPNRGAWLEFENCQARYAVGQGGSQAQAAGDHPACGPWAMAPTRSCCSLFEMADIMPDHPYIQATIERDPTKTHGRGPARVLQEAAPRRSANPWTMPKDFWSRCLFTPRRYDLGRVGRYKLNRRLGLEVPLEKRTLTPEDLVRVVERIIQVNNGIEGPDDIDHLGNRRVKTMGELIQNQLRIGLLRMERVVRERMSIREPEQMTPISLDQRAAGGGCHARVLWRQPALAVHAADQSRWTS